MKRLLSMLLTCAFLLGALTACGDGKTEPQTASSSEPASASTAAASAEPASAAAEPTEAELEPFAETENFPYPFPVEEGEISVMLILTREQALYDYDTMWLLLEQNFPFFPAIQDELGIDAQAVKAAYRAEVEELCADGKVGLSQYVEVIQRCLAELYTVGHLYLFDASFRETVIRYAEGMTGLIKNVGDLVSNARSEQVYTAYEKAIYQTISNWPSKKVLPISYNGTDEPDEVVQTVEPGVTLGYADGVPYVGMTTFSDWTEETEDAIYAFLAQQTDAEDLILDIRYNRGGSTGAWQYLVAILADQEYPCDLVFGVQAGALNLALNPDLLNGFSCTQVYTADTWREEFPDIPTEKTEGMDAILKMPVGVSPAKNSLHFQGKIWVLTNESNYSASDQFAYFCKVSGFATLVGAQTGGNGVGAQPCAMALPWSGLLIYYAPYLGFNPDGTCNGIYGTMPDCETSAATALTDCLALIWQGG